MLPPSKGSSPIGFDCMVDVIIRRLSQVRLSLLLFDWALITMFLIVQTNPIAASAMTATKYLQNSKHQHGSGLTDILASSMHQNQLSKTTNKHQMPNINRHQLNKIENYKKANVNNNDADDNDDIARVDGAKINQVTNGRLSPREMGPAAKGYAAPARARPRRHIRSNNKQEFKGSLLEQNNGSVSDNLSDFELSTLLAHYFKLPQKTGGVANELSFNDVDETGLKESPSNSNGNSLNCGQTDCDTLHQLSYEKASSQTQKQQQQGEGPEQPESGAGAAGPKKTSSAPELPRPSNLSVLMLSHYPPVLQLKWNFNELLLGPSSFNADFYATSYATSRDHKSSNNQSSQPADEDYSRQRNANSTGKNLSDSENQSEIENNNKQTQMRIQLQAPALNSEQSIDLNGETKDLELSAAADSPEMSLRRQLIKKSLTCFQVMYHVVNSKFKILEEYPPSWRNITMEWLLPATEYSLRVIAVYANRHRVSSEPVLFVTPSDEKSRRFREGTYRPIHRSPDDRRDHKTGLEHVRSEELTIVAIAIGFWLATIYWFFNKWGKIRMLEPYQPAYREVSPPSSPFGSTHHHAGITSSLYNLNCPENGSAGENRAGAGSPGNRPSPTSDQFCGPNSISAGNTPANANTIQGNYQSNLASSFCSQKLSDSSINQPIAGEIGGHEQQETGGASNSKQHSLHQTHAHSTPPLLTAKSGDTFDSMDGCSNLGSGTSPAGLMQIPAPILTNAQARRASRSLLMLGHKRYGTTSDEPAAAAALESLYRQAALANQNNPSETTINYLFQKKAQALARATNIWNKHAGASGSPVSSISSGKAALAQFQSAARKVGADEVELLTAAAAAATVVARSNSPSGGGATGGMNRRAFKRPVASHQSMGSSQQGASTPPTSAHSVTGNSSPSHSGEPAFQHGDSQQRRGTIGPKSHRRLEYQALRAMLMRAGTNASDQATSPNNSESIMNRLSALVAQNTSISSQQGRLEQQQHHHQQQQQKMFAEQPNFWSSSAASGHQTSHRQSITTPGGVSPVTNKSNLEDTNVQSMSSIQNANIDPNNEQDQHESSSSHVKPRSKSICKSSFCNEEQEALIEHEDNGARTTDNYNCSMSKTFDNPAGERSQSSGDSNRKRRMLYMKRTHEHHQQVATNEQSTSSASIAQIISSSRPATNEKQLIEKDESQGKVRSSTCASDTAREPGNGKDDQLGASYNEDECSISISNDGLKSPQETCDSVSFESQSQQSCHQSCSSKQPRLNELRKHRIQIQPPSPTSLDLADSPSPVEPRPSSPLATCSCSTTVADAGRYTSEASTSKNMNTAHEQQPQICLHEIQSGNISNSSSTSWDFGNSYHHQQQQVSYDESNQLACSNCATLQQQQQQRHEDAFVKLQRSLQEDRAILCPDCRRATASLNQRYPRLSELRREAGIHTACSSSNTAPSSDDEQRQHAAFSGNHLIPLRPRMSSMFVPFTSNQGDNFAILSTLGQKKSKSAEDVAYLSSLVLKIWTGPEQTNPLLKNVSSHPQNEEQGATCGWLVANKRRRRQTSASPTPPAQTEQKQKSQYRYRSLSTVGKCRAQTSKSSVNVSQI